MATAFYSRTNDATGGVFFDRTNDADLASGSAFGDVGSAASSAPASTAVGYVTVTLVAPLYSGFGSITYVSNFTGTPAAGDIVRYPTTNNFQVLPDSSTLADVNSGAYVCFYTALDGSFTDFSFTVNLSGTAEAFGDIGSASASVINGSAIGFTAGAASGLIATATTVAPDGAAVETQIATGDIGTATTTGPDGVGSTSAFPGDALASVSIASAFAVDGTATGMAVALGTIGTATALALDGIANEAGRGIAIGLIPAATAITVDGTGRAQWGRVEKAATIWTLVPKHG